MHARMRNKSILTGYLQCLNDLHPLHPQSVIGMLLQADESASSKIPSTK